MLYFIQFRPYNNGGVSNTSLFLSCYIENHYHLDTHFTNYLNFCPVIETDDKIKNSRLHFYRKLIKCAQMFEKAWISINQTLLTFNDVTMQSSILYSFATV